MKYLSPSEVEQLGWLLAGLKSCGNDRGREARLIREYLALLGRTTKAGNQGITLDLAELDEVAQQILSAKPKTFSGWCRQLERRLFFLESLSALEAKVKKMESEEA
jgi:hypothetical protein